MNQRIVHILSKKNLSASKFADEIGVQRSGISHIISGRNKPSLDFIQKIIDKYPEISPDWLISGKGNMYRVESGNQINKSLFDEVEEKKEAKKTDKNSLKSQKKTESATKTFAEDTKKTVDNSTDVEKIVVFYKNKTFSEYYPGK